MVERQLSPTSFASKARRARYTIYSSAPPPLVPPFPPDQRVLGLHRMPCRTHACKPTRAGDRSLRYGRLSWCQGTSSIYGTSECRVARSAAGSSGGSSERVDVGSSSPLSSASAGHRTLCRTAGCGQRHATRPVAIRSGARRHASACDWSAAIPPLWPLALDQACSCTVFRIESPVSCDGQANVRIACA